MEALKLMIGDICIIDKEFLDRFNTKYPSHRKCHIDNCYYDPKNDYKFWIDGHWVGEIGGGFRIEADAINYYESIHGVKE